MAWLDDIARPHATVVGRFVSISYDSDDPDLAPDAQPLEGTVTLTPTISAGRVDDVFAQIMPVTLRVLGGEIVDDEESPGVRVLATDANIGVADWAWTATFNLGDSIRLEPLSFKAPRDRVVNLTSGLIPIKSQPYQIIEGASIVDAEVSGDGTMRFELSDGSFTRWIDVPNGEQGIQGIPGVKGDPGDDGVSATLTMGAVSQGSVADAWMTGTETNKVLNLTLPRGAKGEPGNAGPPGPPGPGVTRTAAGVFTIYEEGS